MEEQGITMLSRTKRIIHSTDQWKVIHIPRDQNLVADRLTKLSLNRKSSLHIFEDAPKEILELLQEDKANNLRVTTTQEPTKLIKATKKKRLSASEIFF
ncbi:magnesium transporter MRS2-1 [Gossypium australe]|uniref:Magnesium transporter MRS2-1 n=1 Tax=Gossypium australe TaxID=47621 RepID=A0A5B6W7T8_9ROSI|nr:magnesium transporter MRS2-1 [Gossypium australe]